MSSPNPQPAQDTWVIIQGLDYVDKKLLGHPGVAHIPSILEENELPEALTYDGGGKVLVATDRRIVEIETSVLRSSVRKVTSHPYQTILSFEADRGFMAPGFSMVTGHWTRTFAAQKVGREEFALVVNSHLRASLPVAPEEKSRATTAVPPVPTTEVPPDALWFAKGVNGQVTLLGDRIRIERRAAYLSWPMGFGAQRRFSSAR